MDNKIYNWKDLKALIASQGYKHVRLTDLDGKKLVNYNAINKKQKGLTDKLREIETRMKVLQPGVYILDAQTMYGNTSPAMSHYLGVGKYDPRALEGEQRPAQQQPISERNPTRGNKAEHAVSFETALDNVKKIAELEAKLERKDDIIAAQKETILALEAELDDPETMSDDEGGEMPGWLAGFMPVAEKLIGLSERNQRFKETKLLLDQGYDLEQIFGGKKERRDSGRTSRSERRSARSDKKEVPRPGTRNWNAFVDHIEALDDEDFETALAQLEENDPDVYDALCEELDIQYEEETEEEEEEEQA